MTDEQKRRVFAIVSKIACQGFTESSRLFHDLGIAGDDAGDLLDELHIAFGTKFKSFDFERFFPYDQDATVYHLLSINGFSPRRYRELTVEHLLKVVEAGSWFDPPAPQTDVRATTLLGKFWFGFREAFLFLIFPITVMVVAVENVGPLVHRLFLSFQPGMLMSLVHLATITTSTAVIALGFFHIRYVRRVCDRFPFVSVVLAVGFLSTWLLIGALWPRKLPSEVMMTAIVSYLTLPVAITLLIRSGRVLVR